MIKSEHISPARLEEIQQKIKYRFKDPGLLVRAFTHTSYVNEKQLHNMESNERLEFLGDAILDAILKKDKMARPDLHR